uniref:Uncharacterized protein n=1 Tax=Hyaloperonospora arabidopsidis (strain Emoy2) TaxID=559515 RepID=M4BY79_HYAAE
MTFKNIKNSTLLRTRRVKLLVTVRKVHAELFKLYLSSCLSVNITMYRMCRIKRDLIFYRHCNARCTLHVVRSTK